MVVPVQLVCLEVLLLYTRFLLWLLLCEQYTIHVLSFAARCQETDAPDEINNVK